jgi:hypothetical protein
MAAIVGTVIVLTAAVIESLTNLQLITPIRTAAQEFARTSPLGPVLVAPDASQTQPRDVQVLATEAPQ